MFDTEVHESSIKPAPFQVEDIEKLADRQWSCNWSEMGCYKTSTVLWLVNEWAKKLNVPNPKVLIITTRSGKGTYFKHVPDLLPEFDLLNLTVNECHMIMDGFDFQVPFTPEHTTPSVFVAHYNVFSRRKAKEEEESRTGSCR